MARYGVAFVLIPVAIFFSGCASQQQADSQAKEDKAAAQEAAKDIGSIDDAKCQSFGVPGSAGYIQCRNNIARERSHIGIKE